MKLTIDERKMLHACCECAEGKGISVGKERKRIAKSLVRKGLAWTMESIFMVCIATPAGRAALEQSKEK